METFCSQEGSELPRCSPGTLCPSPWKALSVLVPQGWWWVEWQLHKHSLSVPLAFMRRAGSGFLLGRNKQRESNSDFKKKETWKSKPQWLWNRRMVFYLKELVESIGVMAQIGPQYVLEAFLCWCCIYKRHLDIRRITLEQAGLLVLVRARWSQFNILIQVAGLLPAFPLPHLQGRPLQSPVPPLYPCSN